MTFEHGGYVRNLARLAGCDAAELLDFSASINPLGPPDCLRRVLSRHVGAIVHYPDPYCTALRAAIGSAFCLPENQVVCGNGSTELLHALPFAFSRPFPGGAGPISRAVIPVPSYADYATAAARAGLAIVTVPSSLAQGFGVDWAGVARALTGNEMVIVGQPGNPTGALFDPKSLLELATRFPNSLFVVDEAFADFVPGYESLARQGRDNVVVLRSMTKFYGIPGLRLGYALAPEPLTRRMAQALPPWSVGTLAQAVGAAMLKETAYADKTRRTVARFREGLWQGLRGLGEVFRVFPSAANYLLVRMEETRADAATLAQGLLAHRIAIRVCDNYQGLTDQDAAIGEGARRGEGQGGRYFRVAVRAEAENERLIEALRSTLGRSAPGASRRPVRQRPHTPALMFQGTASNAGKSVLAAAFCRILVEDGYRVAPFKAQNMSLNSYVTRDGGEMGRAQVVQAQACGRAPDVRMNPVLLKPNTDTGAQVIVNGKPVGNMDVGAYFRYKREAFESVRAAYDSLASEVDVMVLEGAGSPGEVNLKRHDIVNMGMAAHAESPVVIVGDIDRGGVFASFVGTMEVLWERERARVAGFIVNRFRGEKALLADAMAYVRAHTGAPVLGVIPYLWDLGLPEEDSVSFQARGREEVARGADQVEVALVSLPHISNFTDFDPLEQEPDVALRVVRRARELGAPDVVVLPGSKNVPGDLAYLRESGLAQAICALSEQGVVVFGVCAGMQILGEEIADPHGLESAGGACRGLGLLPIRTVLAKEKTLQQVRARHAESGLSLQGYEIHHGVTTGTGVRDAMIREDGTVIGFSTRDGRVTGAYLHGLFDNDVFRRWFLDDLRVRRGLAPVGAVQTSYDLEPALDRLAAVVRENLDVAVIYQRMGLG
uniref:Cobyric acid synthase n=1 Tax=Candidatus Kentrum sp. MB TaxID=2138164 RepID=A0A450X897_9GAMM|nr:MAG: adenosylcobyric acid synthase (glutamine-hydrolysing) [Candidatus Kentron sp. MB]VFK29086.1 MAG: adenosylcobyric acid synthase (glutamine-hydrolysing) [Candidatus Kentron sp. MB]VFK74669.1 MAG: adenosylcobyric acid synthase (glutamine-hydrolysing) [Candidatus Kentron sp. MB]